ERSKRRPLRRYTITKHGAKIAWWRTAAEPTRAREPRVDRGRRARGRILPRCSVCATASRSTPPLPRRGAAKGVHAEPTVRDEAIAAPPRRDGGRASAAPRPRAVLAHGAR